jgi:hypothetical protein
MELAKLNKIIEDYKSKTIQIVEGYNFSHEQTIKLIELYYNSQYETGSEDQYGNPKPFYNIVKYRVNVAVRSTDIDTKDMNIVSDDPVHQNKTWLFQKKIDKWMKDSNFAYFLNQMGSTRTKYGGVMVKKVESKDTLSIEVCDWRNIITDPCDYNEYTPIIECHYMNKAELWAKRDVWDNVEEVLDLFKQKDDDIEIYEISGMLPNSIFNEEDNGYSMRHIFYYHKVNEGIILFDEDIDSINYKYLPYDKVVGRMLGVGIVEDGFEAQRWTNDLILRQKAIIDIASKIIFKTNDDQLGNNVLVELDNGDVIKIGDGKDFTQINNVPSSLPVLTTAMQQWDQQLERTTSTFSAITGESMPSGTPYRLGAILNQEATSLFDYRREEAGIFLNEIFTDWVFPFLEKQSTSAHTMVADFTVDELKKIDEAYATEEANKIAIKAIDNDTVFTGEEYDNAYNFALESIASTKTRRFLDVPQGFFKGMAGKVTLVITNENKNKSVQLESLSNILAQIAKNPTILQNPQTAGLFNRIIELSGVGMTGFTPEQAQADTQLNAMEQQPAPEVAQ